MAFGEIKPVNTADELLDIAIKRSKKQVSQMTFKGDKFNKFKSKELRKIEIMTEDLASRFNKIIEQYPVVKDLNEFYKKMFEITIGVHELKKVMSSVIWAKRQVHKFSKDYTRKIKSSKDEQALKMHKRAFFGRVSSVVKKVDYKFLNEIRKIMQSFPVIKQKYKQVAIAGFPNVGKSTLLKKLSGSKVEIAPYAFTTKGIMVGYFENVQLLDTPGTLNRLQKMNYIEQQAYFAMKLVAEKIIYVFDLTESYPISDQEKLYKRIKELGKPMIVYISKTDILDKSVVDEFVRKHKNAVASLEKLKEKIK